MWLLFQILLATSLPGCRESVVAYRCKEKTPFGKSLEGIARRPKRLPITGSLSLEHFTYENRDFHR